MYKKLGIILITLAMGCKADTQRKAEPKERYTKEEQELIDHLHSYSIKHIKEVQLQRGKELNKLRRQLKKESNLRKLNRQ